MNHLEQVEDFQYLGSWVDENEKDVRALPEKHTKNILTLEISLVCLLNDGVEGLRVWEAWPTKIIAIPYFDLFLRRCLLF